MSSNKIIYPGEDFTDARKIGIPVFVKEQNVPQERELDDNDKISYHAVLFENEIPVACGRLYYTDKTAHIGRVAVLKQYRRKGYATAVCKSLINLAISYKKVDIITLDAQTYVVGLYKKLGFKVVGKEFLDENMPHFKMKKVIRRSVFNKICIVLSIIPWLCTLFIWLYNNSYDYSRDGSFGYNGPPILKLMRIISIYIEVIYVLVYWIFIIIVIYKFIKKKRNWVVPIITIISYILFIVINFHYNYNFGIYNIGG